EQHYREHPMPARIVVAANRDELKALLVEVGSKPAGVVQPRSAAEKAWLEMATKNAQLAIRVRQQDAGRIEARLEALREALDLPEPPARVECFDISHTMGEATVASCVVCVDGAMKNSEYRRYNISGIT